MRCMFACCCWDSNRSFSMFLPRCETVQHFRCYVVAMPSSTKRKHAYHRESSRTIAVLASFCLVFDLWFYSGAEKTMMPFHDHPFVFTAQIGGTSVKKRKRSLFPDHALLFPAAWKTTLSSLASCHRRNLTRGVRSHFRQNRRLQWSLYSPFIHRGVLSTERPKGLMAIILFGEQGWSQKQ